jgi:succinate dehydrogenase/fumarate reductase flavoprotein subunit
MADVDVVVVGSGAAGLSAALAAQEEGARVVVAESESIVGGASRLSAGMLMAADTEIQRALGLEDDPADLYQEYMLANQFATEPGLVHRISYDGADALKWLIDLGVNFLPHVMQGGGERVPRSHVPEGGGQHIVDVLHRHCRERGIDIALGTRVDRLLVEGDAVAGVAAGDDELAAPAVVIATGGFGANRELIEKHLPTFAGYGGDWIFYIGPESCRGDSFALGEQVGAQIVGHDICHPLPSPHIEGRDFDAYLPSWLLIVGPDGRRVMDETFPYGYTFGLMYAAGGKVWGLFDAKTRADNNSPDLPTFKPEFPPGSPMPPHVWAPDSIDRLVASGAIVEADTLEGVVEALGLPVAATIGTIERYNQSAALGEDRDFLKAARFLRPIEQPPFYGVEIRPSTLGIMACGLEIDASAQVLNANSAPIPGLFAAGECTGGVIGPRYIGSGNGIAQCVVFGRAAGRGAAAYAKSASAS